MENIGCPKYLLGYPATVRRRRRRRRRRKEELDDC
jgi:hypothetical protein